MPKFSLSFDMRAPSFGITRERVYAEALDMCSYVDGRGLDYATVMELHGDEDGYLPTPFVMAAAIAARTRKMRIQLGAVVLPIHDPVKVAEQIAVVDIISNGRLDVVLAAGYVKSVFAMFRRSLADRARLMDTGVPLIQRALTGERFMDGDREVVVRPLPIQKPHPPIFLGGGVPATARRAARFNVGLFPMNPSIIPLYEEECRKLGRVPGPVLVGAAQIHISEDPDRTWSQIAPHVLHVTRAYAALEADAPVSPYFGITTIEQIKEAGLYQVLTPDEAVKLCADVDAMGADLSLAPLIGGIEPAIGWQSIELFLDKVLPRIRN